MFVAKMVYFVEDDAFGFYIKGLYSIKNLKDFEGVINSLSLIEFHRLHVNF